MIPNYIENAERRIAESEVMGPNNERVWGAVQSITHPEAKKYAEELATVATGTAS